MSKTRRLLMFGLPVAIAGVALAMGPSRVKDTSVSDCGCFAPELCGDQDVLCPAGPDCFQPELCHDRDVMCPGNPQPLDAR